MWTVYILECSDGTLYTGLTNDLPKRLAAHDRGTAANYTRGRGPFRVMYLEKAASRSGATRREQAIKSLPRAAKLRLIRVDAGQMAASRIPVTPTPDAERRTPIPGP